MEWTRAKAFKRASNIYLFSKDSLQKNVRTHLYAPWSEKVLPEFMYKLKAHLKTHGPAWIPFMQAQLLPQSIHHDDFNALQKQLENSQETHLIMSNMDSIHILNVAAVKRAPETTAFWNKLVDVPKAGEYGFWIKVDDFYVQATNHQSDEEAVKKSLKELLEGQQTFDLFNKISSRPSRWLEVDRSVTFDYFTRASELEKTIYEQAWNEVSRLTQHYLVSAELFKRQSESLRGEEKFYVLTQTAEALYAAAVNELNEVYIRPIYKAFDKYIDLKAVWDEVKVNHRKYGHLEKVENLEDFFNYIDVAKSLLFTLKSHFTKRIDKEEFLLIESFLSRQEALVESYHSRELEKQLNSLLQINAWLKLTIDDISHKGLSELEGLNLKLSHILSLMTGISREENLFFALIEEKTSKALSRKKLDDKVKELVATSRSLNAA